METALRMESVSLKLQASAMICLMVATTLVFAATPTSSQNQAVIAAANTTVSGIYTGLETLSEKLHNAAVAFQQVADANKNDGTLGKINTFVAQNKSKFMASLNTTELQNLFKKTKALGYRGDINDFERPLKAVTQTEKSNAYAHGMKLGSYTVMSHTAQAFEDASQKIKARLAELRHPARFSYASFHYHAQLAFLLPETCAGLDWGLTFLGVVATIIPLVTGPLWVVVGIIWWGVVRGEVC